MIFQKKGKHKKMKYCPECGIGLSRTETDAGFCKNCHCDIEIYLRAERVAWDGRCRCGHLHSEHSKSTSINYSAGSCSVGECRCKHFLMPTQKSVATSVCPDCAAFNKSTDHKTIKCWNCENIYQNNK